ncbi:MAG TPA: beta-ketoacyl-[acyl-carrier-protein] synthase family protein [Streptosporangiaceae bacterium]
MEPARVVVTGVGIICAAGRDAEEFWRRIRAGTTALSASRRADLARYGKAVTGEVPDAWIEQRVSAEENRRYSREVLLGIVAARESIRHAGLDASLTDVADRTALVLGKCQALNLADPRAHHWIHSATDEIASALDVSGPRNTIATACSAGSNAVGAGRDRIWAGDADIALVGGVDIIQESTFAGFYSLQALDSEPCSPYSRSGGLSLGEGAAFLVLERLEHASRRGAPILAEVLGYGLSADAYHATAPDPTGRGASLAVLRALTDSGLAADDVTYVNGHGTGTKANDAAERRVMRNVFGARRVPLTSTKSFVGHTLGAAGAVEAVTSVLSIAHGLIPPTVNFAEAGARPGDLDFVPNEGRPAEVDVVVSNSYAFGGNNASLVLARPRPRPAARRERPRRTAVITGIGLVGRPGIGVAEWKKFLAEDVTRHPPPLTDGEITQRLAGEPFAAASTWRQMSGFTRLCMAASRLAVEDAELPLTRDRRDDTGLILGTMSGPAWLASRYPLKGRELDAHRSVHEFSQVTLNAPAGAVCRALGIRGVTTTITSGGVSGTLALEAALEAIELGRADAVIVLAVEEACPEVEGIYQALGKRTPAGDAPRLSCGTASVALVVESAGSAERRNARVQGRVAALTHVSDNYHPHRFDPGGERYAAALRRTLERAALTGADVSLVAGSGTGTDLDAAEHAAFDAVFPAALPVVAVKLLTGECEAASGLLNVAAPLLLEPEGNPALPAIRLDGQAGEISRVSAAPPRAIATSASFGGTFGAALIERTRS